MMRPRGGFTSYVGYGALTLILMYVLFLYNATKSGLNSCDVRESKLKDDKKELLSHLSGKIVDINRSNNLMATPSLL